jgi:hypothetical protein
VTRALAALKGVDEPETPIADPSLAPLALAVRDAWARTHRGYFLRHIADLRARSPVPNLGVTGPTCNEGATW